MVKRTNSNPNNAMAACGWESRETDIVFSWWEGIGGTIYREKMENYFNLIILCIAQAQYKPLTTLYIKSGYSWKKKKNFYRVSTCEWMLSERCCDTLQPQHIALISASWAFQWQRLERSLSHSVAPTVSSQHSPHICSFLPFRFIAHSISTLPLKPSFSITKHQFRIFPYLRSLSH